MSASPTDDLPDANSTNLVLRHPTAEECITIWTNTSAAWVDSLTPSLYLEESAFLTTIPLARDGGMTLWILVHEDRSPGERPILCSCESFFKRSLTSTADGTLSNNIVHGIASVFCPESFRRRGYAARMMRELRKELSLWQTNEFPCVGTTLYSDIGKKYYSRLGWPANTANFHVEIPSEAIPWPSKVREITGDGLQELCERDEVMIRSQMAVPAEGCKTRFTIIPDIDHMGWHIGKEIFASEYLFGKVPTAKGAIIGSPGSQIWALWTHRYYGRHDVDARCNVLYILRLVVEIDETATRLPSDAMKRPSKKVMEQQTRHLKWIMQAAQAEASEWHLDVIKLWDPTPLVGEMLAKTGIEYESMEREEESIASLMWYDASGGVSKDLPLWLNNEHYAWQ